jgi:hypothetical protein
MLEARRKRPEVRQAAELLPGANPGWAPALGGVELVEVFVPNVQGKCEIIGGATPAEKAANLWKRIVATGVFSG